MAHTHSFDKGLALATALVLAGCGQLGLPGLGRVSQGQTGSNADASLVRYTVTGTTPALLGKVDRLGLEIEAQDPVGHRARVTGTPGDRARLTALGLSVAEEVRTAANPGIDSSYMGYAGVVQTMQALASAHGDVASIHNIGPSWETSRGRANRPILAMRIGPAAAADLPVVVFVAEQHAREIVTPEMGIRVIRMLLEGRKTDPALADITGRCETWVVPMSNPDGHAKVVAGENRRKNMNDSQGGMGLLGLDGNAFPGVDLNRNFPFHWGEVGASKDPLSPTFRGAAGGSEPETQALMRLIGGRNARYMMSYHSYSNLILWPWGHTEAPAPDPRLPGIGRKLAQLTGYRGIQSKDLYLTSGDISDWAFGTQGTMAFTAEVGSWDDGFTPPFAKVPQYWRENEPAARYLLELAAGLATP
ncbi:MAG: M14 family zinc carboxypeptidase [Candidatus Sericytochromatia bacterium]|nr:M14 family zinc carboxypeptidase [Candidatus Sericytochromatia bacterium]